MLACRPYRYLPVRNADGDHARQDEVQVIVGGRFLYDVRSRLERCHLNAAGDCVCNGGIPARDWLNLQCLNQSDVSVRPAESLEHIRQFRPFGLVHVPDDLTNVKCRRRVRRGYDSSDSSSHGLPCQTSWLPSASSTPSRSGGLSGSLQATSNCACVRPVAGDH